MIDDYRFGRMVIDGKEFRSDLIIFPDGRVQDSWWRESGHRLSGTDIADLVASAPEIIVAGTGAGGLMNPESGLEKTLSDRGIEFRFMPSKQAAEQYNALCGTRKVGACFHLTC